LADGWSLYEVVRDLIRHFRRRWHW